MSDLRDAVIELAYDKPELREHLLPLVKTADDEQLVEYAMEQFNDVFGNFRNKPRATYSNTEVMDIDVTEGYRETNVEFYTEITIKKRISDAVEWLNDEIQRGNLKVFDPRTKEVTERMLKSGIEVWDDWSIKAYGSYELMFTATLNY
jgi:hypothetical protein